MAAKPQSVEESSNTFDAKLKSKAEQTGFNGNNVTFRPFYGNGALSSRDE